MKYILNISAILKYDRLKLNSDSKQCMVVKYQNSERNEGWTNQTWYSLENHSFTAGKDNHKHAAMWNQAERSMQHHCNYLHTKNMLEYFQVYTYCRIT